MAENSQTPLHWRSLLKLGGALFLIMGGITLTERFVGQEAVWFVTFLSGLFELHGVAFTLASSPHPENARMGLALAYPASLISKTVILFWPSHGTGARSLRGALLLLLICIGAAFAAGIFA